MDRSMKQVGGSSTSSASAPRTSVVRADFTLPQLNERVLSTLNEDGSRRWLSPREVRGRFWRARWIVAWSLIAIFTAIPWMRIAGKPPLLLDLMRRQFTFFGTTFCQTETLLLALLLLGVVVLIFLVTALFGRVWCGWACPQTVYMEFLFRPMERWILGATYGKAQKKISVYRSIAMYALFLVLSAHLANTFLAYFVGTDRLVAWTNGSPADHPVSFGVFAATTALMMFHFTFFREQLCTIVCPYGRLQSVLLDRNSLVIGYDKHRGEPRAGGAERRAIDAHVGHVGECVDCTMCVQVCPTGIDIRDGLQLECVNCAQCIDACDAVMDKVNRPRGLIRYSTQNQLEKTAPTGARYRLVLYSILLSLIVSLFVWLLAVRPPVLIEQVRLVGLNFTVLPTGEVATPIRLLIENRTASRREYTISHSGESALVEQVAQIGIASSQAGTVDLTILSPSNLFHNGSRVGAVTVSDDAGLVRTVPIVIAGPFAGGGI